MTSLSPTDLPLGRHSVNLFNGDILASKLSPRVVCVVHSNKVPSTPSVLLKGRSYLKDTPNAFLIPGAPDLYLKVVLDLALSMQSLWSLGMMC